MRGINCFDLSASAKLIARLLSVDLVAFVVVVANTPLYGHIYLQRMSAGIMMRNERLQFMWAKCLQAIGNKRKVRGKCV